MKKSMTTYARLWNFTYLLLSISLLWAVWIFGGIWMYFDEKISAVDGGTLIVLLFATIIIREVSLAGIRKEVEKTRKEVLTTLKKELSTRKFGMGKDAK